MNNKKLKGFTLIELVIVIAIIAILISIAIPRYGKSSLSARAAAHNANVKTVKNAAALYITENSSNTDIDSIEINKLEDYFDGDIPKPDKSFKRDFSVSLENGDVKVSPGMVEVVDKEIKEVK